jgi:hypothetical protein
MICREKALQSKHLRQDRREIVNAAPIWLRQVCRKCGRILAQLWMHLSPRLNPLMAPLTSSYWYVPD